MTVQELIEKLKHFPPDMVVHCHPVWHYNGNEYSKIYDIESVDDCKLVTCSHLIEEEKENYVGIFIR